MLGRGALRRGRRRGRRRARRRTMMVMNAMNQQDQGDQGDEGNYSPQDDYSAPEEEDGPAFSDDDAEQLEKLAELKDKGIITEEEFNKKKKQILGL